MSSLGYLRAKLLWQNVVRICQLPLETQFDYPWTLRQIPIGEQVDYLTYSPSSETYVLGTSCKADFKLPDDDELHPEWRNEGSFDVPISWAPSDEPLVISFLPEVERSSVKVVSPKTWSVIDRYGTKYLRTVKSD